MVHFGPVPAEIDRVVWGTPANFNGLRVVTASLQGTLRRRTEGATYIRHGGNLVGHWPTCLVIAEIATLY